jgi:hypothetical protein
MTPPYTRASVGRDAIGNVADDVFERIEGRAMKHKTLFRMLLKLIGVWTFVGGVQLVLAHLSQIIVMMTASYRGPREQFWYLIPSMLTTAAQLAMGAYLFFGGKWIVDLAIPGNRPYCHECGYDLTDAPGHVCTECGTPFKLEVSPAP